MSGHVYKTFKTRDGRRAVLRALRFEDLDDLLECINSLVEEGADIIMEEKQARGEEAEWLAKKLVSQEEGKEIFVAAEVDGKIIANSSIERFTARSEAHKGMLGIAVRSGYRDLGIGTEMIEVLIEEARKAGLRLILLDVFETNKRARHVYEKIGFTEVGRVPKGIFRNGKYIDEARMALEL